MRVSAAVVVITAVLALLHARVALATTISTCVFTVGDYTIDLTGLAALGDLYYTNGNYDYHMFMCGTMDFEYCSSEVSFSQVSITNDCFVLGTWTEGLAPSLIGSAPTGGVRFTLNNGDGGRSAVVQVTFDSSSSASLTFAFEPILTIYQYNVTAPLSWITPSASGSGLSGGWIFIIILVVGTALYFAIGAVFMNQKKGATGKDMIPNRDFWLSVPGLVKDGCRCTYQKLLGLVGKSTVSSASSSSSGGPTGGYGTL